MEVSITMEKIKCELCGKEIVGWNKLHAEILLRQHKLIHVLGYDKIKKDKPKLSWKQRRELKNKIS